MSRGFGPSATSFTISRPYCAAASRKIAASGFRVLVEARVVYAKSRNLVLSAIVLMVGISGLSVNVGQAQLKGMVLGTFVGMILGVIVFFVVFW